MMIEGLRSGSRRDDGRITANVYVVRVTKAHGVAGYTNIHTGIDSIWAEYDDAMSARRAAILKIREKGGVPDVDVDDLSKDFWTHKVVVEAHDLIGRKQ